VPLWTLFGLRQGQASTSWPAAGGEDGQAGVLGMPRFDPQRCREDCSACAEACLTHAISIVADAAPPAPRIALDYGRCIACQLCVDACPAGALQTRGDWALAVRDRDDLVWRDAMSSAPARDLASGIRRVFGRSLHIRHVDAGSCNGCESELQALNNPFYNLHRLGVFFTASPRFADLLLVTGPVTYAMRAPLRATFDAMPEPRWVMANGTCAVCGGVAEGGYAGGHGLDGVLPVDVWLPGCPPNPAAVIHALLRLLERAPAHFSGGRRVA
jgi:formate hydrogenlyase subunit 7